VAQLIEAIGCHLETGGQQRPFPTIFNRQQGQIVARRTAGRRQPIDHRGKPIPDRQTGVFRQQAANPLVPSICPDSALRSGISEQIETAPARAIQVSGIEAGTRSTLMPAAEPSPEKR